MLNVLHGAYSDKSGNDLQLSLPFGVSYFDQVQVWLTHRLPDRYMPYLCQANKSPLIGKGTIHVRNQPMKYWPIFRQRLQIRQVQLQTLHMLADMNGGETSMVNYAELARDFNYGIKGWCVYDRDEAFEVFNECWTRPHHRPSQGVRVVVDREEGGVTVYDGPKGAPQLNARYTEEKCRMTIEAHSLHLERRLFGAPACKRHGIVTIEDLMHHYEHELR